MTNPLARAIMGNNLKTNKQENLQSNDHNNFVTNDVDKDFTRLINDLIQGENNVVDGSSVNKTITLEEAADRVRKGI